MKLYGDKSKRSAYESMAHDIQDRHQLSREKKIR